MSILCRSAAQPPPGQNCRIRKKELRFEWLDTVPPPSGGGRVEKNVGTRFQPLLPFVCADKKDESLPLVPAMGEEEANNSVKKENLSPLCTLDPSASRPGTSQASPETSLLGAPTSDAPAQNFGLGQGIGPVPGTPSGVQTQKNGSCDRKGSATGPASKTVQFQDQPVVCVVPAQALTPPGSARGLEPPKKYLGVTEKFWPPPLPLFDRRTSGAGVQ